MTASTSNIYKTYKNQNCILVFFFEGEWGGVNCSFLLKLYYFAWEHQALCRVWIASLQNQHIFHWCKINNPSWDLLVNSAASRTYQPWLLSHYWWTYRYADLMNTIFLIPDGCSLQLVDWLQEARSGAHALQCLIHWSSPTPPLWLMATLGLFKIAVHSNYTLLQHNEFFRSF